MRFSIIALVVVFLINTSALFYNFYKFFWFDLALHFSGGFFVAMFFYQYIKKHLLPNSRLTNMLIIVGSTVFIGVVWEFVEFLAEAILTTYLQDMLNVSYGFMGNLEDTIVDLLMDILGAISLAGLFLRKNRPISK